MKNYFTTYQCYSEQQILWPQSGNIVLASFDSETIIVYQAYSSSIADYVLENKKFGGSFCYNRMSWIKTSFLWMMHRSNWATKTNQERVLAIRLSRCFFNSVYEKSVPTRNNESHLISHDLWRAAVKSTDVLIQWDPDYSPEDKPLKRKAVQLGLRNETLRRYGEKEIIDIYDITPIVIELKHKFACNMNDVLIPVATNYLV